MAEDGITFICPAKDEGSHIAETLTELYQAFSAQDYPFEMLCIDDGSGDDTGDEMERFAAGRPEVRVIHFEVNRGLGEACRYGYEVATQPYAMFVPTNGMLDPRSMFHKFGRRAPDTVIMFDIENIDQRPLYRKIPSVTYHEVMTRYFGIDCGYIHSMLLLPTKAIALDDLRARRSFHVVEILVLALLKWGLTPVTETNRIQRRTGVMKTKSFALKNLWEILLEMRKLKRRIPRQLGPPVEAGVATASVSRPGTSRSPGDPGRA